VVSCDIGESGFVEHGRTLAVEFEGMGTAWGWGAVCGDRDIELGKTKVINAKF
jgi:hypothetical protein